jgi:hypothetical protein
MMSRFRSRVPVIGVFGRHVVVHGLRTGLVFMHAKLTLPAHAADGAQHGRRHCASDREQDGQQQQ